MPRRESSRFFGGSFADKPAQERFRNLIATLKQLRSECLRRVNGMISNALLL
jgi:hypothetical protein